MRLATICLALWLTPALAAEPASATMAAGHDHAAMQSMARPKAWTSFPLLKIKRSGATRDTTVVPQNIVVPHVDAYSNRLDGADAHRQLPMDLGGAKLGASSSGGFHMLTAREESAEGVRVASTVYYFGERGAKNPTAMFMQQKNELEIIPQPHPREHSRYRANENWRFLVRFNGQPLPNHKVILQTSNGSKVELSSDAQGMLQVQIPDDFKPIKEEDTGHNHGMMRRGAELVLATERVESGKTYLTAFNTSYGPDAYEGRSLAMGIGFMLLGMAGAAPLLRQRKQAKKQADETAAQNKEA